MYRKRILALACTLPLALAACSDGKDRPASSTASSTTKTTTSSAKPSSSHATTAAPSGSSTVQEPGTLHPAAQTGSPQNNRTVPHNGTQQGGNQQGGAVVDGVHQVGQPCTDQSVAPGHYISMGDQSELVCEITGDAPR